MNGELANDHPNYATDEYAPTVAESSMDVSLMEYQETPDAIGYAALVKVAGNVVTCAHAEPRLKKLAERWLRSEIMRWGELTESDDD